MCDSRNNRESGFDRGRLIYDQLPAQFNLAEYLLDRNQDRLDKIAFYHQQQNLTYRHVQQLVPQFASLLQALGSRREERVIILLPDCPEFVIAWLGTLWNGQVAVPLNEAASLDDLAYMLDDSRARVVISTKAWQEKLQPHLLQSVEHWLAIDSGLLDSLSSYIPVNACKTHKDEAAFWSYTSGSTGKPKGVIHAHYSPVVASVRYAVTTLGLGEEDKIYTASPMAFSYGLGTSLYMPLFVGASAVLADNNSAFGHIDLIHAHRPTVFFAIPHHYATLMAAHDISPLNPSSIRLAVSAAEQLSPHLWQAWKDTFGLSICEGTGTTESTHIFISNRPDDCRPGSTGMPVEGYSVQLRDEDDLAHPDNLRGMLHVSGEGMMLGYWNRLQETQSTLQGNVLRTADVYQRDEQGHYEFLGRKDSLMKIAGMWVAPGKVEHVIAECEGVREAALVVVPGQLIADTTELACFWVAEASMADEKAVLAAIKQRLMHSFRRYQLPKQFIRLSALPRTATGKIDRKQLQEA